MPPRPHRSQYFGSADDKFVALVSGLKIGANGSNPLLLQLLVDHLTGYLGEPEVT